jgi:hypothetical protein
MGDVCCSCHSILFSRPIIYILLIQATRLKPLLSTRWALYTPGSAAAEVVLDAPSPEDMATGLVLLGGLDSHCMLAAAGVSVQGLVLREVGLEADWTFSLCPGKGLGVDGYQA